MNSILQMLRSRVIPWAKLEEHNLVMTRSSMGRRCLPSGTSLSRRPLKGKRVVVKNRRGHANQRVISADWPQSNQQEMALPKLACVVDGCADYLLGDYCLHANAGTFILIPAHAPHHGVGPFLDEHRLENGECTMLFAYTYSHGVFFWFSRSADGQHINDRADSYLIPNAAAVQIFNLAMQEAISGEVESETICKSLLVAFLTTVQREIEAGHCMSPVIQEQISSSNLVRMDFSAQVREYIQANLHKRLKVKDAAAQMYVSSSHFSRLIRKETGTSFGELLTRCRMERAQELLKETDWTVTFIAGYVGLKSTAYFHEFFHRHAGCTPLEYRNKHLNKK